jgi:tRNA(fMet)-specific endonuclease VapC
MNEYLLDTNTIIYVMKKKPIAVLDTFNKNALRMTTSTITVSELIYGTCKSAHIEKNMAAVQDFLSRINIIDYDINCSEHFGDIKAKLAKAGNLIGENNIHIAACARSHNLILVTNNEREFSRVEELKI